MSETRWLSAAEKEAWKNLSLMQLQVVARLSEGLAPFDLSYQDYNVLALLADDPDGRCRVSELARQLGWEKSRASHHIRRMVERGLVKKVPCAEDQRGAWIVITAKGKKSAATAAPQHVTQVRELFIDVLSPSDVRALTTLTSKVLRKIDEN